MVRNRITEIIASRPDRVTYLKSRFSQSRVQLSHREDLSRSGSETQQTDAEDHVSIYLFISAETSVLLIAFGNLL